MKSLPSILQIQKVFDKIEAGESRRMLLADVCRDEEVVDHEMSLTTSAA